MIVVSYVDADRTERKSVRLYSVEVDTGNINGYDCWFSEDCDSF